jgi:hypothetical protein
MRTRSECSPQREQGRRLRRRSSSWLLPSNIDRMCLDEAIEVGSTKEPPTPEFEPFELTCSGERVKGSRRDPEVVGGFGAA